MGTFTIHSIGDSAFLEQILIAVAMITGSGDFTQMVSIGLLLGVIMICFQSIFQGAKQLNFQQILVGWILYACFFGPTVTVDIEDAYTGEVRVVANVPIGVGFAGGIISNVGYTITNLFESGYGVIAPRVTESHFNESLKLLNDVRRKAYDPRLFTGLNAENGGGYIDTRRSWNNYIRECTLTKIDLNLMTLDELLESSTDTAFRFTSELFGTRLYLSPANPDGENYTCTSGWVALRSATQMLTGPIAVNALNNLLGLDTDTGDNAITELNNSLQSMGASTTTAMDYLKAAVLEPLYYEAASGRYQDMQDYGSALMINQAIQQRNTQWAAEQSMFMTVVRPMLTFFEGFIYAITPIIAFIVVMGSYGVQLAGKYVQTILWIQLWMPVLAIINLFVYTAASNQMASLSSEKLNSMYALSSSGDILQHWIATGGMLAAATPLISLFIVTGSTYAFTSLASKVGGSDHVDEKIQTPDLLKQGPVMESQPAYKHNQFSGTMATGAESMIGSFSIGSNLASGVSSAQTVQSQKSEAFQSTLGRGFSDGASQDQTYSRLSNIGRTVSSQDSDQSKLINDRAKGFMKKFGVDNSHSEAVKGGFALQAQAAVDGGAVASMLMPMVGTARAAVKSAAGVKSNSKAVVPAGGGKDSGTGGKAPLQVTAQARAETTSTAQDSASWTASDVSQYVQGVGTSETDSQALTNQLAQGFSRSGGEAFKQTWGDTSSKNLSKSASELTSAAKTYTTLSQLQKQMGSITNTDFKTLGGSVAHSFAGTKQLNDFYQTAPSDVKNEAEELTQRYQSPLYGMPAPVAQAAARLTAITNSANYDSGKEQGGYQAALQVINTASGRNHAISGDAYRNNDIEEPNAPGLFKEVQGAVGNGPNIDPGFREKVAGSSQTNPASEADQLPTSSPIVQGDHATGVKALNDKSQQTERAVSAPHIKKAQDNLINAMPDMSASASTWGAWGNTSGWGARKFDQVGAAVVAGGKASSEEFSQTVAQLQDMTVADREQFIESSRKDDEQYKEDYGSLGAGFRHLDRSVLGAVAIGINTGKELLTGQSNFSEAAKDMSTAEIGAFYAGALSSTAEAGVEATQAFYQQHGEDFKETLRESAQNQYGLTPPQAAVFAEGYDTDKDKMAQAVTNLKMEYAELNPDGKPMMEDGQPVLSPQNEAFTDKLVNVLQNSTDAGDRSGSYLTQIGGVQYS